MSDSTVLDTSPLELDRRVDWSEAVAIALNSFTELFGQDGCYFIDQIMICDKEWKGGYWTEVEVKITTNRAGSEFIGITCNSQMRSHSVLIWEEAGKVNKRGAPYASCAHWFICSLDVTRAI